MGPTRERRDTEDAPRIRPSTQTYCPTVPGVLLTILLLAVLTAKLMMESRHRWVPAMAITRHPEPNMAAQHFKYAVLGGGNAAGYATKEFVQNGVGKGEVVIIGEEKVVSYERPALSKGYLFPEGAARLPGFHTCVGGGGVRQAPEWYDENGITFLTGTRVVAADLASKTLTLSQGGSVTYDKLIIATGARPTKLTEFGVPGADLEGLLYLRDVADADTLVAAIKATKEAGGKAVVVGGGYIGAEVGAALALNGVPASIVMPEDRLMARILTPQLAAFYEKFYAGKGVTMVKGAKVTGFEGKEGKVVGVRYVSSSGEEVVAEAGLVVVGVGARPNVELFTGQLELAAGGIKVDGSFATSAADVYAIGDVATFPLLREGGALVRQEHVTHCRQSAAQAVKAAMGLAPVPYDYLPFFYSRVFNLGWVFYGKNEGSAVHFGNFEEGKFGAYWVSEGKVVGAFLESGTPDENNAIKKVVMERPDAGSEEALAAAGLDFASKL